MFQRHPAYAIRAAGESATVNLFAIEFGGPVRFVVQHRRRFGLFSLIEVTVRVVRRWRRGRKAARALGSIDAKLLTDIGLSRRELETAAEYFSGGGGDYPVGS